MIDEDLQEFSESHVMRTIAIGRLPISNLPKKRRVWFLKRISIFFFSGDRNQRGDEVREVMRVSGYGLAVLPRGIANFLSVLRTDPDLGPDLAGVHVELRKSY
ncbi:hypothetical protein AVEN_151594-1 [Araneus ventricosus]|uniref:Uncharacterized protein n=1 Tax=Araneus ventricosus TaxID=182803 RepID=A0A4Y2HX93_ARAVE|nr:hypothetical protein AVEN_151594-1 [Araneus ventricosus]